MPAGTATYEVAALATNPVTFTPGTLPHPAVDGLGIVNGQYFALTAQVNLNQNGIWYADPAGPTPIMTATTGGIDPAVEVEVTGGLQNSNQNWVYGAAVHGAPGLVLA
jgi:hypothetical protein